MAFVSQGWKMVVALRDRGDKPTSRTYYFVATDTAGDMTAVQDAADGALAKLIAVTDLKIASYNLSKVYVEDGFALSTSPTSDRSTHAEITGTVYQKPNKHAVVEIPGPKDSVFVDPAVSGSDTDIVDVAATAVTNWIGLFTHAGNVFYISDGEQIADGTNANLKGKRTHSSDRNG